MTEREHPLWVGEMAVFIRELEERGEARMHTGTPQRLSAARSRAYYYARKAGIRVSTAAGWNTLYVTKVGEL